jgi:hypothetical protein
MSNSVFTPTVLTVPASGGGTGTGQGEINLITDSIGASGGTGWSATGLTVTRDTSGSPLDPVVATGWTLTATAASQYFTSTTIAVPSSLRNRKLKIEFYYTQVSGSAFRLEVSRNSGFTNDFVLTTDVSGITNLPATAGTTGKFTAYFDADSTSPIYVRLGSTGAGVIKITQIVVGPGIQPQGAVVGEAVSYTPTWSGGTSFSLGNGATSGLYRRVGSFMEIEAILTWGSTTSLSGNLGINLPSGFTLGTVTAAAQAVGTARIRDAGVATYLGVVNINNISGSTNIATISLYNNASDVSNTAPFTFGTNDTVSVWLSVPIAEWAGSGTVQLAQNDVEFASNGSTFDSTDITTPTFVYGPAGAGPTTALTALRTKRIRFQSPVQSGDKLTLEFSTDRTRWFSAQGFNDGAGNAFIPAYDSTGSGSASAGAFLIPVSGSATDIDVQFFRYINIANDDVPTSNWPTTWYWRVRKQSAGAAVGFGLYQPGVSAGLVSSSGLAGRADGNVVPSGYVGENYSFQTGSAVAVTTTWNNVLTMTNLPAGIWLLTGMAELNNAASVTGFNLGISAKGGSDISDQVRGVNQLPCSVPANTGGSITIANFLVNITTATTYYLKAASTGGSSTLNCSLRAIRIA